MLGFYKGKLTPNEPKKVIFKICQKIASNRNVGDKNWSPIFGFTCPKQGGTVAGSGKGASSIVKDLINSEDPKHTLLRFSGGNIPIL